MFLFTRFQKKNQWAPLLAVWHPLYFRRAEIRRPNIFFIRSRWCCRLLEARISLKIAR